MKQFVLIFMFAFFPFMANASSDMPLPIKTEQGENPVQSSVCTIYYDSEDNILTVDLFQTGDLTILIADLNSGAIIDMVVYPQTVGAGNFEYIVNAPTVAGQYRIYLVMGSATMYGDFEVN